MLPCFEGYVKKKKAKQNKTPKPKPKPLENTERNKRYTELLFSCKDFSLYHVSLSTFFYPKVIPARS